MASLTVRKLDDALKAPLRARAAEHGRSMEEAARSIGPRHGVDLERPPPMELAEPPTLA